MKAAPSGSGRNSYVSSNYSNFLSQNSRRKLPRSSPPRRKRNRRLRPPRGDLRPSQTRPCVTYPRPPFSIHPLLGRSSSPFSRFERGGREKPTRKFQARFSHSRNSTLRDVIEGLELSRTDMRDNFAKLLPFQMDKKKIPKKTMKIPQKILSLHIIIFYHNYYKYIYIS